MSTYDSILVTSTSIRNISTEISQNITCETRNTISWIGTSFTRRHLITAKFALLNSIKKILGLTFRTISKRSASLTMSSWNWVTRSTFWVPIFLIIARITLSKYSRTTLTLITFWAYIDNLIFIAFYACINSRTDQTVRHSWKFTLFCTALLTTIITILSKFFSTINSLSCTDITHNFIFASSTTFTNNTLFLVKVKLCNIFLPFLCCYVCGKTSVQHFFLNRFYVFKPIIFKIYFFLGSFDKNWLIISFSYYKNIWITSRDLS